MASAASSAGPSIGTVTVAILPDTSAFWSTFVSQTAPGAAAAGAGLGEALGKAMAARIRAQVEAALRDLNGSAGRSGAAAGNNFGGKFAATARARIQAALRSLPEAQIGVATNAAEQKLRDLRAQLETLSTRQIGVDITETQAREEIKRLKLELDQLAQTAASPRIRVDSGNASIELRELERELERLDGRRANAVVDVDDKSTLGAIGRMGLLVNAALTLGPALIPAAAAAAGAIGGIGLAAVSAAPAVGVLALAFGGIGGAVKALSNAQSEQAKTANTSAQQSKSLASTADQVRSAERALANTRAQAADQQRRSLQQVAQAQRDALRAQAALNDAREEEARSQQDAAFALRQNAIDQRRAAAEVAAATAAAARGGGQQAKNDLEEAILRQEELRVAGDRLAAEQEQNQKTGVEGSKRVVAAQEQVAAAVRGEAEARSQAASQARQSAQQITQAQQAIVTAQRSAGAATVAAASTSGAALDKLNDELSTLPVSGQAFARFLVSLKPELAGLREAAADGLLPGAQAGITRLLPYLSGLKGFVHEVAVELGNTAERAGDALQAPFWRQFFNYIGNDAIPVMRGLFTVTGNLTEGFAGLLLGFQPFERQVGGGFLRMSERFLVFSKSLEDNKSFRGFVSYALAEGPRVVAMLGALVDTGVRLGRAYSPVGSVVVAVLRGIAGALNAIPLPVLTGLVVGITAYKTAVLIAAGVQGLLNSGLLTGIGRMITYKTVTDAAGVSTTLAQRAITGASGAIGGPFVLAVTAAVTVIGLLISQQQKAKAEADAAKTALQDYAGTFKDGVTPAAIESSKATLAHNAALRGIVETTQRAGIGTSTLIAGLNGDREARDKVVASLDAQIAAAEQQAQIFARLGPGQQQAAKDASDHAVQLKGLRAAFITTNDASAESAELTGHLADEQQRANDVFDDATPRVKSLGDAYRVLANETSTAAEKADALKVAEDALFGAARNADEAAEAQAKAIRSTNALLDERGKITDEGSKKLDVNSEAGTRLRDSLKDQLAAINATFRANVAAGQSIDEATKKHDEEVAALKRKVTQQGVNKDAVQKLIDIYGQVPTSANTAVTISGLDGTKQQLDELLDYQYALRNGLTLGEAKDKLHPLIRSAGGQGQSRSGNLATGGPVVGPGTGTSDSVPAMERTTGAKYWLSNGEFVQPTASVDYYGHGVMRALQQRTIPREAIRGFATGGLVDQILRDTYPFPTTTKLTRIPSREEVAAVIKEGPSSGGSEAIKAFIRSTDALPYIWANAGPHGYDCSGLASAVYGLVTGKGGGHGQRYFTTYDFANGAPAGFKPGGGGVLTVGVNPQSHMAGNYGGLGFEAASTRSGIKIGTSAKKVSTFEKQFHLASGGLVGTLERLGIDIGGDPSGITADGRKLPFGAYDSGGRLPQGLSLAYNGTGRPEAVVTEAQERGIGGTTITIPVHSDGHSVHELAKAVAAELAWTMR